MDLTEPMVHICLHTLKASVFKCIFILSDDYSDFSDRELYVTLFSYLAKFLIYSQQLILLCCYLLVIFRAVIITSLCNAFLEFVGLFGIDFEKHSQFSWFSSMIFVGDTRQLPSKLFCIFSWSGLMILHDDGWKLSGFFSLSYITHDKTLTDKNHSQQKIVIHLWFIKPKRLHATW